MTPHSPEKYGEYNRASLDDCIATLLNKLAFLVGWIGLQYITDHDHDHRCTEKWNSSPHNGFFWFFCFFWVLSFVLLNVVFSFKIDCCLGCCVGWCSMKKPIAMKLFQSVQKFYETMGIFPSQHIQRYRYNLRNAFFLISASLMFISTTGYLLFETATFLERAESFYAAITVANCVVYFIVQFTKREETFALIGLFEEFINKRMYEYFDFIEWIVQNSDIIKEKTFLFPFALQQERIRWIYKLNASNWIKRLNKFR